MIEMPMKETIPPMNTFARPLDPRVPAAIAGHRPPSVPAKNHSSGGQKPPMALLAISRSA